MRIDYIFQHGRISVRSRKKVCLIQIYLTIDVVFDFALHCSISVRDFGAHFYSFSPSQQIPLCIFRYLIQHTK